MEDSTMGSIVADKAVSGITTMVLVVAGPDLVRTDPMGTAMGMATERATRQGLATGLAMGMAGGRGDVVEVRRIDLAVGTAGTLLLV